MASPKFYLKDVNFDFEKNDEVSYDPHIAYTLGTGAASGKNDPFVLKSIEDFDILSSIRLMKSNGIEINDELIKKAGLSYNNLQSMLTDVVRDSYGEVWLTDFTDKVVVFNMDGIYYAQTYKRRKDAYELTGDKANVIRCEYWQLDPNNVVSEEAKAALISGADIIEKSFESGTLAELLEHDLLKSETEPENGKEVKKEDNEDADFENDQTIDEEPDHDQGDNDDGDEDDEEVKKYLSSCRAYSKDDILKAEDKEPLKTFRGSKYPAKDFAYTPDLEKPSGWKLPIFNAEHAKLADQALNSGIWGNKVKIPESELAEVKRKVSAANKKFKNKITKSTTDVDNQTNTGENLVELDALLKSDEAQALINKMFEDKNTALLKQVENLQKEKTDRLTKSYENIVKSAECLDTELQADVVKSMLESEDQAILMHSVIKSFTDSVEAIKKEMEAVKSEFATTEHGSSALDETVLDTATSELTKSARQEALKAALANQH